MPWKSDKEFFEKYLGNEQKPGKKGGKRQKQGYVYFVEEKANNGELKAVKIGFTTNPKARLEALQTGNPNALSYLGVVKGTLSDERRLHRILERYRTRLEWFEPSEAVMYVVKICIQAGRVPSDSLLIL